MGTGAVLRTERRLRSVGGPAAGSMVAAAVAAGLSVSASWEMTPGPAAVDLMAPCPNGWDGMGWDIAFFHPSARLNS